MIPNEVKTTGVELTTIADLTPDERNANKGTQRGLAMLEDSLRRHGAGRSILVDKHGRVIAGNKTLESAASIGLEDVVIVKTDGHKLVAVQRTDIDLDTPEGRRLAVADNRTSEVGLDWNVDALSDLIGEGVDLDGLFSDDELSDLLKTEPEPKEAPEQARATLAERFLVPPFSVLDARQGYWQERKRAWLALGIQSELGRGENALGESEGVNERTATGEGPYGKQNAAPGGSLRPAAILGADGHTVRGDGKGRSLARSNGQDLMRGEHTLGAIPPNERAILARSGKYNARPPHGPSVTQNPDGTLAYRPTNNGEGTSGTSIFDPVLCELAYRWFCPPGGHVLDPFAGGSVRGIVAVQLGREYTGIDLRPEQVAANEAQAASICPQAGLQDIEYVTDPTALTPVQERGQFWLKRDDLFTVAGVRGGKARSCYALAQGATGLITAGSRHSPQVNIVAHIAQAMGVPCRAHVPSGKISHELVGAQQACAEIRQHEYGRNSVIIARAKADADETGWRYIPFGMECAEAVQQTRAQVANLPREARRLVVPVGSGMSLAGILWGMADCGLSIPVVGVVVGADPEKRLEEYAPPGWRDRVQLVESGLKYDNAASDTEIEGVSLDPIYEAKCVPFLQAGDCLWCVGTRAGIGLAAPRWLVGDSRHLSDIVPADYDFLFSCPPYFDLEQYSNDPADLSNTGDYGAFVEAYRAIIAQAVSLLKPDRFACFTVGDVRDKAGIYRNFVSDTIAAFQDAGAKLYNEAILVTACGSLPIRAARQFPAGRKLGKTHQNVLVFVKGDPQKAVAACGPVEVGELPEPADAMGLTPERA